MQLSLQAPASVNVTLALPSSPLCSSRWRAALPIGLALHQSTAGQICYEGGLGGAFGCSACGPS